MSGEKCYRPEDTDGRCRFVNDDGTCGHEVIKIKCIYMKPIRISEGSKP